MATATEKAAAAEKKEAASSKAEKAAKAAARKARSATLTAPRATFVLGLLSWVVLLAGLFILACCSEWVRTEYAVLSVLDAVYLETYPVKIVYQAWGISLIGVAVIARSAGRTFAPAEKICVCQILYVIFGFQLLACVWEVWCATRPDAVRVDPASLPLEVVGGLGAVAASLTLACYVASLDEPPFVEDRLHHDLPTSLEFCITCQSVCACPLGLLSIFYPSAYYDVPRALFSHWKFGLVGGDAEVFAIQCWGTTSLAFGFMCMCLTSPVEYLFSFENRRMFGLVMVFYLGALAILYVSEWDNINVVYRVAGTPYYAFMAVWYLVTTLAIGNDNGATPTKDPPSKKND